eukprot:CAMPEP_0175157916 /NCGR_PEP_ID=MMETSP0087-20121206/22503_1 /TAXON_ID=136419 /ORGANISM="Unknown Unknown, Strain D1" /LENGTH=84 /DNA_ID=CAMNT_0016445649 /DNA_START=18 /DNA_END=272 /DNA_ORIENTATION=+
MASRAFIRTAAPMARRFQAKSASTFFRRTAPMTLGSNNTIAASAASQSFSIHSMIFVGSCTSVKNTGPFVLDVSLVPGDGDDDV